LVERKATLQRFVKVHSQPDSACPPVERSGCDLFRLRTDPFSLDEIWTGWNG